MKKALIAVTVVLLAGCGHMYRSADATDMSANPQATIITISGNQFSPASVTVPAGRAIYWRNNDQTLHRIVLDDRRYDSSDINPGTLGCGLILSDAGTHTYHDFNNPSMTGTITVSP